MNRDYDIDSILAEIKQKKAAAPRRAAYQEDGYEPERPARPARPAPEDYEPEPERPVRRGRPAYDEEYEEPAPRRRAAYEEDGYEPERPARPARRPPEDYEPKPERPVRRSRPVYDEEYEEPAPRRRAAYEEDAYEPERPARPARPAPEDYEPEPERPVRRSRPVYDEEYEEPAPRRRAAAYEEDEYEPERPARPARRPLEDDEPARPARRGHASRNREEPEDEFIMKYSGLSSLGSRKPPRQAKESIYSNFGTGAEPLNPREKKAASRKSAKAARPEPEVRAVDGFTRLDLPLSGEPEGNADFDSTRDLPLGLGEEGIHIPDDYAPEPPRAQRPASKIEMDEYQVGAEAPSVRADLGVLRGGLLFRFIATILLSLGLLYLGLAQSLPLPLPEAAAPDLAPRVYMIVSVALLAAAALVNHSAMSRGVTGLVTLKANNDSLAALAVLASVIQGTSLIIRPDALAQENVSVYASVAAVGLLFHVIGRMFTVGRIAGNFRVLASSGQKYVAAELDDRDLARDFTWDMNIEEPHVAHSMPVGFAEQFVEQSYADDTSDSIARITVPVLFLGSLVVAVLSFVFSKDLFAALSAFAAILAIAAPFTATLVGSLPLHKAYRALSRWGAMLTGYNAVERFSDTNVVLADACELFTSEEVLLHNIKTFEKNRIDEAILDAASVLCMCNSAVKNIFLRIIQGNTKMLKPVENLVYEDGMGISAWVDGKRVLIGNSDLMRNHGIDTPSRDYESKYRTEDRDILYLANSGELTAMFVISYVMNEDVDDVLGDLEHKGISLVVKSMDPNLTAAKIARIYDLPEEMVRILPAKLHPEFDGLGREAVSDTAYIVHSGGFAGFARAVSAAGAVKLATNIGLIVQIVGMILGYALVTFFSFMGSMDQASVTTVLIYQLIWTLAVWLFTSLRRI